MFQKVPNSISKIGSFDTHKEPPLLQTPTMQQTNSGVNYRARHGKTPSDTI